MILASAANVLVWMVWVVAAFACLGTGIAVISFTNPFYSALSLIGNLASLAVMYLLLSAEFVAAAQVLVYAGAVMVMFLFVIAYLGGRADAPWHGGPSWQAVGAVAASASRPLAFKPMTTTISTINAPAAATAPSACQLGPPAHGASACRPRYAMTKRNMTMTAPA